VEYDAQGRRLITIAVDLESDARAVNTPVAQTYIDFYEVVFKGPDGASEYYSATTTKGAGRRLSLRVPVGTYTAYLNAGYMEGDDEAVLLAQAAVTSAQDASTPWTFTLAALDLHVNKATVTPADTNPIYVTISGTGATTSEYQGIPYYTHDSSTGGLSVAVTVNSKVTNVVDFSTNNVAVTPLIRKSDKPPVVISITSGAAFVSSSGVLTFGFSTPAAGTVGVSNIGFDVEVAAVSATRTNGKAPVRWHIRNGLDVEKYDNGSTTDATNTGAGLVFAFGGAKPTAQDEYEISVVPPSIP
jgi:hypothetical protein